MLLPQERQNLHASIFNVIEQIKRNLESEVFAVGMTAGDEFQAVLNSPAASIEVYQFVRDNIQVECYFGVGYGSISHLGTDMPAEMYGEAFYRSRLAIETVKKTRNSDIEFRVGDELLDCELNIIFQLINSIRRKQTKRQKQVLKFLASKERRWHKDAAEYFQISEQAISKIVKNSGFETIQRAEHVARTLLIEKLPK